MKSFFIEWMSLRNNTMCRSKNPSALLSGAATDCEGVSWAIPSELPNAHNQENASTANVSFFTIIPVLQLPVS
jgi:hypothetical protein